MLIIILRNKIMIFIGCASPAGLSYCFFSIDALGSSSIIRFEPIEQRSLLANSNRHNRLKKSRSNHQRMAYQNKHLISSKKWNLNRSFHSLVLLLILRPPRRKLNTFLHTLESTYTLFSILLLILL